MLVKDLIEVLKKQDQNLPVAYYCYSEMCMLEEGDLDVVQACEQRNDGWIANERPDKPKTPYLVFPGN